MKQQIKLLKEKMTHLLFSKSTKKSESNKERYKRIQGENTESN